MGPYSLMRRFKDAKMSILPKSIYKFKAVPIKSPVRCCVHTDRQILKLVQKCKFIPLFNRYLLSTCTMSLLLKLLGTTIKMINHLPAFVGLIFSNVLKQTRLFQKKITIGFHLI